MSFAALSHPHFFRTLYGALIIMLTVMGAAKATEQDVVRLKVLSLSQQAEEAAKRGDLEEVQEALSQVGSLDNLPSMKKLIIGYPDVQEILGRTMQVVAEVYLKEAEEAYKKGEEERTKSILKQAEQITQQLPTFIKGPIVLSEPVQERVNILKQDIAAKAEREALKKEEDVKRRLAELEEENRRAAEKRKAQNTPIRPVEQTDQNRAYQEGQSLASSLMGGQTPSNPEAVPGYAGTNLSQSQIKAHDLGSEAVKASQSSEASNLIAERFEKGGKFVIDPHTDPLIVAGNQIINDPQKTLDETVAEAEGGGGVREEIITCEEGGDEYEQSCSKRLEIILKVIPEVSSSYRYCPGNHPCWGRGGYTWNCYTHTGGCATAVSVSQKKEVKILKEEWVDGCTALEAIAEKGICRYVDKTISPKNETRTIDGEPITRDHFEEHFQYACLKTSNKSCSGLREKGCYQVKSVCKEEVDGRCVLWEQTYLCPSYKKGGKSYRSSSKESPFCLSGDCADNSYEANQDFVQVMSHMSVLKEAGADLRSFGSIFKGVDRKCTRHCVGFKDCCGNGKGWGVSLSFASCDVDEKELAELRARNRCVQVGTYCAEKSLGLCIRKKTTFCCYDTKLAKIVQEQGKGQLGLGFGSPEHPQCQGLTPEQLSRIDFSRINFSDIFSEIVTGTKTPNPEAITKSIQQSMENKGSLLKPTVKEIDAKQTDLSAATALSGEKLTLEENLALSQDVKADDSISMTADHPVVKELKEEPLITPSIKSIQPGNELSQENTPKLDNFQIQGRTHGQF